MKSPEHIGSYRIERLLGVGSFATVWLGLDPDLGAHVAIKVLAENWSHDERVRERFLDEARLLWRLDHSRLVRVHAIGELTDGRPYLVMAWAEGGSLRDLLAVGPLDVVTGLEVLLEVVAGAAVLHENRIVHRDLTPGNILFRRAPVWTDAAGSGQGQVLIADLGLAKALAAASGLTARAGTPGFMAPEQDDPLAVVDVRTDVFALGRLGELLLTGRSRGSSSAPVLRPGVPANLADVLRRATAYRAEDRYADAAAFGTAVRLAAGIPPRRPAVRAVRARRTLAVVGLAVVVLTTGAAAGPSNGGRSTGPRVATDASGRIQVTLPDGWQIVGSGWERPGPDGGLMPALVMSPAPTRWLADPSVSGAFVGLAPATGTADQFVAGHQHAGCVAAPARVSRAGALDWVVAAFSACRTGKPVVVEAAATGTGGQGIVWAQIAPPPGAGSDFVDTILAGVRLAA